MESPTLTNHLQFPSRVWRTRGARPVIFKTILTIKLNQRPSFMCCVPRMSSSKVMSISSLCHVPSEPSTHHVRGPMVEHDLKKRELMKKVTSVRKGLQHLQQCHDHHNCDKALCKSTRRLVDQYRTHACINRVNSNPNTPIAQETQQKCQVCLLWTVVAGNTSVPV